MKKLLKNYEVLKALPWQIEKICSTCKEILTTDDICCSNGLCPYCGAKGYQPIPNNPFVKRVFIDERVFRWVKVGWFKWIKEYKNVEN